MVLAGWHRVVIAGRGKCGACWKRVMWSLLEEYIVFHFG